MADKTFTTFAIARMVGVFPTTVGKWIDDGTIKGYSTPGGHRRVREHDLRAFFVTSRIPMPPELAATDRFTVLIVDDEAQFLTVVKRQLKAAHPDWTVEIAADGYEAGEKVATLNPSAVVLDIMLPGLDGYRVCAMIKERHPAITVVAVTGYDAPHTRERVLAAGADAYFAKPFDIKALAQALARTPELHAT